MKRKIVIIGAGDYGQNAINKLDVNECIMKVVDSDENKVNTVINGHIIENFEKLYEYDDEIDIFLICMRNWYEVYKEIFLTNKINYEKVYIWDKISETIKTSEQATQINIKSQDGEELFLQGLFKEKLNNGQMGTYIDVGAYDPYRFSNTFWAYNIGWRGINIDANPDTIELFNNVRKNDINICCGISNTEEELDYYRFNESGVNTFNKERICQVISKMGFKPLDSIKVKTRRLDSIFEEYGISYADFIDIDVETMEYEVLNTIDFSKISFGCILVEQLGLSLVDVIESDICILLEKNGYVPVSKYNRTIIYIPKSCNKYIT